jgi:preprotein translocase subunit YajC
MSGLLIIALLFALFWFMLIRPQRSRAREQQELIRSLEPGDEIVTTGGIYGVITQVDGDVLHVEIADGLVVRTARSAVAGIVEVDEEEDVAEDDVAVDEVEASEEQESAEAQARAAAEVVDADAARRSGTHHDSPTEPPRTIP